MLADNPSRPNTQTTIAFAFLFANTQKRWFLSPLQLNESKISFVLPPSRAPFFTLIALIFNGFLFFRSLASHAAGHKADTSLARKVAQYIQSKPVAYPLLVQASRQIGHRLTGSANGRAAEDFIYNALKKEGIGHVTFDSFAVSAWKRGKCHLEVVPYRSDNYTKIEAVSLANAASAEGLFHIVDGGDGLEADLIKIKDKIKGNCLMVNLGLTRTDSGRHNLHRAEKVALALRHGASAVLMVHPIPSDIVLTGTASLTGAQLAIPVLCISGNDGAQMRSWMRYEKLMADMKVKNEMMAGGARNIVARWNAPNPTDETIVFCGHLDCWDLATGATDNGLGAFALLDVARAMESIKNQIRRNVLIMWTMGEEQGLLGSTHFVEREKAAGRLASIKAVINLDMVGNPHGFNTADWPGASHWFAERGKEMERLVPSFTNKNSAQPGLHSDHQPFMLEGIPAFSAQSNLPDSIYRCYHANCDLIGLIEPSYIHNSSLVHSVLASILATEVRLPFKSMKPKKLSKWLQKHGLKEKLVISNQWPWKK